MELRRIGKLMVGASPDRTAIDSVDYIRAGDIAAGCISSPSPGPAPARGHETKLAEGDIVVRGRGAVVAAVVGAEAVGAYPTNDVIHLRVDPQLAQAEYVAAFLNLPQTQEALAAGAQGAVLSRLSIDALGNLDVPLPPLEIQRKIAELAAAVSGEVQILENMRELRSQLGQELLRRAMKKTHGEGGNPRREPTPTGRRGGSPAYSHPEQEQ